MRLNCFFDFSNKVASIIQKEVKNDSWEKKDNDIKIFTISRNYVQSPIEKTNAERLTINVNTDSDADKISNYQNTKAAHLMKIEVRHELLNKLLHECSKETSLDADQQRRMKARKIMIKKLLRHCKKDEYLYGQVLQQLITMEEHLLA